MTSNDEMRERESSDAPVWYDSVGASAWANGYNAAVRDIRPRAVEPKRLRVFRVGDTAPGSDVKLRDSEGYIWETSQIPSGMWCNEFCQWVRWEGLLRDYGPLTEVPDSPQVGA